MIYEVDSALRSLILREAADGTDVEVVFDAPTKDWASRRNVPTIDVYLYDIREDLRKRERGLINEYDGTRVAARHLPPRHFKLSYLVTAWTQRPEDEHRLLSALLACFLRHDAIPTELVTGSLADLGLPVPMSVALPPPEDRSFADVWSALGGELKPSLDIVISAPTSTGQRYVAAPIVTKPNSVTMSGVGDWPPAETRRGRFSSESGANGRDTNANDTGNGNGNGNGNGTDNGSGPNSRDSASDNANASDNASSDADGKGANRSGKEEGATSAATPATPATTGGPARRRRSGLNQRGQGT